MSDLDLEICALLIPGGFGQLVQASFGCVVQMKQSLTEGAVFQGKYITHC